MTDLQWNRAFALEQTADDEELLDELLDLFKDSSASDFDLLSKAVAANDPAGVISAAHSLKGASASLGVEGIRQLAGEMEAEARGGSITVASENLDAMGNMVEQLKEL